MSRYSSEAEESVIGACLASRDATARAVSELDPGDFFTPALSRAFEAIVTLHNEGAAVDVVTVADQSRVLDPKNPLGRSDLLSLLANTPAVSSTGRYVQIIRREAAARREQVALALALESLAKGADPSEMADSLAEKFAGLDRAGKVPDRYWSNIDTYLDMEHRDVGSPLIPGVLYKRTRVVLIARAKVGKSVLARTLAYAASQGLHPFRFTPMEPVRTLILDAENDDDELVPAGLRLRNAVSRRLGVAWDPTRLALFSAPYGLNVLSRRDRSELEEVLEDFHPQLIVGGPVYKLIPDDEGGDRDLQTGKLQGYLDRLRRRYGCALVLEHHTPTGDDTRAKGGQRWEAWPEMTVRLTSRDGELSVGYPHPPRGQFDWPRGFTRGKSWEVPWVASFASRPPVSLSEETF